MSVNPKRGHQKKSWWKKNSRRTNTNTKQRNRTFENENSSSTTTQALRNGPNDPNQTQAFNSANSTLATINALSENGGDILTNDPENLTPRQIRTLQTELSRSIRTNNQLEMELNLRASQVEQMEDNLRLVADQSKMIGVRAMEQEQKLLEIKKALELKTKQLALFRGSKADQIELNVITVLPMHLRGKFSEFLRGILLSQKKFFEQALKDFVANQITDKELAVNMDTPLTRQSLLLEIAKIGNSLALDFMSELELRLNGTFSSNQSVQYTLHNGQGSQDTLTSSQMSRTPQRSPNPPPMHMQQRPVSPMYNNGTMHMNNNTLSSQGPPMINMNAPSHTPQHSVGSAGAMTPQTSMSTTSDADGSKNKKVKTGGAFAKAKSLLAKGKSKKKKQIQEQQQQQQATAQQNQVQQMQMQQQNMQYPPPYGQQQPQQFHQYPAMNGHHNGPHQYPPAPRMNSIPSRDLGQTQQQMTDRSSGDRQRADNAYAFHKSATSTQNSTGNVAMEALMNEIAAQENGSLSQSGSVVVRDDDDLGDHTDEDYSSDRDDKKVTVNKTKLTAVPRIRSNSSFDGHTDSEEDDDDQFDGNADALAMQQQLLMMTKTHTQHILTKHGKDGSNELNKMWSQFVQFKKGMDRPSDAPLAFTVPDKTMAFVELRDLLEALPFDLSCAILREQQMNPFDRIKDVTVQRGCWPMVRYVRNNRVQTINKVFLRFDDVLTRLEMYLKNEKESDNGAALLSKEHLEMMKGNAGKDSKLKKTNPGRQLLGSLDPQKTTGFRLHQITSIVRQRNEARDTITALNLRVGRLWNMDISMEQNLITDSIDFFKSLDSPSTMLLLGPNTSEKCALCREIGRQLSSAPINMRTALVDTRSTVGGFTKSPIETGQCVRFYVNSVTNQHNQIDATRSIYPQVVVVDEVLSLDDIESIGKLQSEGISVVVGTNMHSLEALLGHPLYSQLLPPQDRLLERGVPMNTMSGHHTYGGGHGRKLSYQSYSAMSPHLLILEMCSDGTEVKMYTNIPAAVKAIKRFSQPEYKMYKLKWQGYNPEDTSNASKYMNNQLHKRTTSRMVNRLMKDTLSYKTLPMHAQ